jgi:hypothetical protein
VTITTLFESEVILRANPGERRELLASQTGHSPPTDSGQSHFVVTHQRASSAQVFAQGSASRHSQTIRRTLARFNSDQSNWSIVIGNERKRRPVA